MHDAKVSRFGTLEAGPLVLPMHPPHLSSSLTGSEHVTSMVLCEPNGFTQEARRQRLMKGQRHDVLTQEFGSLARTWKQWKQLLDTDALDITIRWTDKRAGSDNVVVNERELHRDVLDHVNYIKQQLCIRVRLPSFVTCPQTAKVVLQVKTPGVFVMLSHVIWVSGGPILSPSQHHSLSGVGCGKLKRRAPPEAQMYNNYGNQSKAPDAGHSTLAGIFRWTDRGVDPQENTDIEDYPTPPAPAPAPARAS